MKVTAKLLIGKEYVDKACSFTVNKEVHPNRYKLYKSEHSPIRCVTFWIELFDVPTFCSTHFVRHSIGMTHFVKSNREDRAGHIEDKGRLTPVNHSLLLNAQALINMSRRRLCMKAHKETRLIMEAIKNAISEIDPDLANCMLPDCQYRGACHELTSCGDMPKFFQMIDMDDKENIERLIKLGWTPPQK